MTYTKYFTYNLFQETYLLGSDFEQGNLRLRPLLRAIQLDHSQLQRFNSSSTRAQVC